MRVLAIETSCDETGIAIVEGEKTPSGFIFRVLGSVLLSQAELHAPYGGVFPTLAKREHEKNLPVILEQAVQAALASEENSSEKGPCLPAGRLGSNTNSFSSEFSSLVIERLNSLKVDAIAVTNGPGLEPALWTGITLAKQLAKETGLPLMGANHMEGHLISSLARRSTSEGDQKHSHILENMRMEYRLEEVQFPVLGLLISGGHTEFVLMKDWFNYQVVGATLDDAVGEAFDKVARLLNLPYPGGPQISKLADEARKKSSFPEAEKKDYEKSPGGGAPLFKGAKRLLKSGDKDFSSNPSFQLPRPMLTSKNCDMSFSGLKTAALYALRGKTLSEDEKAAFAREFEDAVGDVFVAKTRKALTETEAKTFVIGGGVAANRYLRERLQNLVQEELLADGYDIELRLPDLAITGDNATMIAEAALTHLLTNGIPSDQSDELRAVGNLSL